MVRDKINWKLAILSYLLLLNVFTKSLPIDTQTRDTLTTTEAAFTSSNIVTVESETIVEVDKNELPSEVNKLNASTVAKLTRNVSFTNVRPGQEVRQYAISITIDDDEFIGRAVLDVVVTDATRDDNLIFHFDDVEITRVQTGLFTEASARDAEYELDDGILEIEPAQNANSFIVIVEYTGELSNVGRGLYRGEGPDDISYLAMNLHPTHARRVFPCMDEPTEASPITFTFRDVEYNNIISNSVLDDNNSNATHNRFRALQGPAHQWGMIAHNFNNLNIPTTNVVLIGRPGVSGQDAQASLAINAFFRYMDDWTEVPYFEIVQNQAVRLSIIALPDVDREWNSLSTIGIWEPYVLMQTTAASIMQRKIAFTTIAQAISRQWFGYVIYPENWRNEWVTSGFATYSAYEALRSFQPADDEDESLLDINTLFVTEVIQESLLRDAYSSAVPLELEEDLFEEGEIRDYIYGLQKYKAPALMHMMRLMLGDEDLDMIQVAAQALLVGRSLQPVNSQSFIDAMNSGILTHGNNFIDDDIGDFLEPWLNSNGYPLINVGLRQDAILITQERFGFTNRQHVNFETPISYTTSVEPDFENIHPILLMEGTTNINMALDDDDYVLFNIQGQGYYRVNYDNELWERIIEALDDPETREEIHPLNRATLVDDALNLARAGRIDYDIAFQVVLTMEHETEYAVWKAFVRNMNFLRKRLVALVTEDEDLDPDIYLRMVRRTIGAVEDEIGFDPDPSENEPAMVSLTRGLVMDHACRANYEPCIDAARDWFYDDDDVNPNIPYDIRPAVYCTMVREDGEDAIDALMDRLDDEVSQYERVVILEALGCAQDEDYIRDLLTGTIRPDNPYLAEERVKIFKSVVESSYENAGIALNWIYRRANDIREWYGGDEKLDEIIFHLADNMADADLSTDFRVWVNSQNNNLEQSQFTADRALLQVRENQVWDNNLLEYVYEWIDENDAPTLAVSLILVGITFMITLFNH